MKKFFNVLDTGFLGVTIFGKGIHFMAFWS